MSESSSTDGVGDVQSEGASPSDSGPDALSGGGDVGSDVVSDSPTSGGVWDWESDGSGDTDDRSRGDQGRVKEKWWGLPAWSLVIIIIAIVGIGGLIIGGLVRGNSVQSAATTTFPSCNSAVATATRLTYNPHLITPYLLGGVVAPATGSPSAQAAVVRVATNTHGLAAVCPYVTVGDMVGVMSVAWQHGKRVGATFPASIHSVLQSAAPGTRFVIKSVSVTKRGTFTASGTATIKIQHRSASGHWTTVGTNGATYRLVELGGTWFVDATEGQSAVILLPAA